MNRYFAALLMFLALALIGFSPGLATAHDADGADNDLFYSACAVGVESMCPILAMDALSGVPEAQYRLAMMLVYKGGKEGHAKAATLIYNAAKQGHPKARKILAEVLREIPKSPGQEAGEMRPDHFQLAKRE